MTTGYFSVTDLLKLKILSDSQTIDTNQLGGLIQSDKTSIFKRDMTDSVNYYNSKHDILSYQRKYLRDRELVVNKGKANNQIPQPFHKILVDEKTAYLTGNPITVGIAGEDKGEKEAAEYRKSLLNILTERFDDVISDWVSGASKKAVEWVHFYVDGKGKLNYCIVPAEQTIPVYDTQYENKLQYMIRFYEFDFIDEKGNTSRKYKVEIWKDNSVSYWTQIENDNFVQDLYYQYNPSPHWFEYNTTSPSQMEPHGWGRVPFIPLQNNSQLQNDLKPIKPLIDAYDKVKSGWANDIEDFTEVLYVIKGLQSLSSEASAGLTELAAVVKNIKEDGAIAVETDGAVSVIKAEIPVEAKQKFLDITAREIIYFGEGSDVTSDTLSKSHAPSGVALQFLYARLDMKCKRIERKLKSALKDFVWFVTEYINRTENKKFDSNKITFTVNKAQIFNETEKIQSLVASAKMLSKETVLENHPYIDDVQGELERIEQGGHFELTESKMDTKDSGNNEDEMDMLKTQNKELQAKLDSMMVNK
jgi:SPP1 family phage portal protein